MSFTSARVYESSSWPDPFDKPPPALGHVRTEVRATLNMFDDDSWNFDADDLSATLDHLPSSFKARDVPITSSLVVRPKRMRKCIPSCILPLNIIAVGCPPSMRLGDAVCFNFDLSICSIELSVDRIHHFTFVCYGTAWSDAMGSVLRLTPHAFSAGQTYLQVYRIAKYLQRGFFWF